MLGIRATPREDSGISAAELVYGTPLTLPGALIAAPERPPEFFSQLFLSRLSSFSPLQRVPLASAHTSSRLHGARFCVREGTGVGAVAHLCLQGALSGGGQRGEVLQDPGRRQDGQRLSGPPETLRRQSGTCTGSTAETWPTAYQ
jgi:hypothetical protein